MNYKLEDLEVYNLSELISDNIWDIVMRWDYFAKDTIGKQICRQLILLVQILQKGMADTILKRTKIFVTIAGAQF